MDIELDTAAAPSSRPTKKLTPEEDKRYKNLLQKFQTQLQKEQEDFNSSHHETYYIVSTDFLNTWRDFCHSHEVIRHVPITMNSSLFDPKTKKMREELREKEDFEFLTEQTYELLKEWQANELKRTAVKIGHEKRVPVYLNDYPYLVITNADLKSIDMKTKRREHLELKIVQESENAVVKDIIEKIVEKENMSSSYEARLWRVDKKDNLDSLFKYLKAAADRANYEYRIKGFGKRLDSESKIEDLQMEEGDFFVVEAKEKSKRWYLQTETEKKCEGCYDIAELKFPCQCEKVAYCSQECKEKDKRFHLRLCEYAEMEELNKPIDMKMTSSSSKGVVGLRNLGNTCFMNSCLQCCSNTEPLTMYFLKSLFAKEINRVNPLGTKGKLAKTYAKFLKAAWCDSDNVVTPDSVKSAVSSINPMFSGYAQHDSQQFFSFLIDGLHEDLNRIEKKPYVESVQSNNRPDPEVAVESWVAHIKRNQSIITDLMTGQYKSKVTCPTCSKESITFDPFITVTLPIPQKIINVFDGFFIYSNFEQKTKRFTFTYSKPSVDDWIKSAANIISVPPESINIYLVSMNEGIYKAGRQSISEIVYKMENENKNIFVVQMTEEQMAMKDRVEIPGRFSKKSYYNDYDNLWFKFPFYFSKQYTGLDIYKRLLKFLFNEGYNDNKYKKMFGGKSFEDYESQMLSSRPFQLFLRYGKKLDRFYTRLEYKFQEEIQIGDKDVLGDFFKKIDEKDCELDVRFPKNHSEYFSFDKLKDFDDIGKKHKVSKEYDEGPIDISQCFETMRESEQLQAGNEWFCPNCKEHKQANKEMSIYRAPKILILHLKRFKQKGLLRKEKNQTKVHFPGTLDMTDYVINPQPISDYANNPKIKQHIIPPKYDGVFPISNSKEPLYDLYAVSNHYGGLGGGHYTAYAKNGGNWYEFNDSSVHGTSEGHISGSGAYMLFYKRRD